MSNMIYFHGGDLVQLKKDLPNKPVMMVKDKVTSRTTGKEAALFIGIKCFWFTTSGEYMIQIFNSKDLEKC
jgi:hypothetical protein